MNDNEMFLKTRQEIENSASDYYNDFFNENKKHYYEEEWKKLISDINTFTDILQTEVNVSISSKKHHNSDINSKIDKLIKFICLNTSIFNRLDDNDFASGIIVFSKLIELKNEYFTEPTEDEYTNIEATYLGFVYDCSRRYVKSENLISQNYLKEALQNLCNNVPNFL